MPWLKPALITIVTLSLYNFTQKLTGEHLNTFYALPLAAFGVLIVSFVSLFVFRSYLPESLAISKSGALLALGVGVFWGFGQLLVFLMYSRGADLSSLLPFLSGGITLTALILSFVLLKEPLSFNKLLAAGCLLSGLFFLGRS